MLRAIALATVLTVPFLGELQAATNIWFIVDSSGSMAGKINGVPKIETAKKTLRELVGNIDRDTRVTLLAYGHRRKRDCSDIGALTGMMTGDRTRDVAAAVKMLKPVGKTPIADSLNLVGFMAQKDYGKDTNTIVLISDGIETCGGNPCAIAGKLAEGDIAVRTHVIGFGVSGKERKQLECIARKGRGTYFPANSTAGFAKAVKGAIQLAQAPKVPKIPSPAWREIFRDDFNGQDLSKNWEVLNPDQEAFIVEDGRLSVLVSDPKKKNWSALPNIFRLNKSLPGKEWAMTLRFIVKPQTLGETVAIALSDENNKKFIAASFDLYTFNYASTSINIRASKVGRKNANFSRTIFEITSRDLDARARQFTNKVKAVELRLQRKGRKYIASARFEKTNAKDKTIPTGWIKLPEITSLRPPGQTPVLFVGSFPNAAGRSDYEWYVPKNTESQIDIDWVKIEAPEGTE